MLFGNCTRMRSRTFHGRAADRPPPASQVQGFALEQLPVAGEPLFALVLVSAPGLLVATIPLVLGTGDVLLACGNGYERRRLTKMITMMVVMMTMTMIESCQMMSGSR